MPEKRQVTHSYQAWTHKVKPHALPYFKTGSLFNNLPKLETNLTARQMDEATIAPKPEGNLLKMPKINFKPEVKKIASMTSAA